MIVFLNDSMCGGGAEKSMARIVNELCKKIPLKVISLENSFCVNLDKNIETFYFHKKFNGRIQKIFTLFYDAYLLKRFVKSNNIKKVVSFQYRSNLINIISKLFGSSHKVIISERNYPEYSLSYLPLFKAVVKILYKFADLVIVNASDTKELLEKEWKIKNVKLIFNGYNKKEIIKKSYEPIEDIYKSIFNKKTIINVGRLTFQKGQKYLIKTLTQLPDYNLVLIGKGEDEKFLKNLAKKEGVEDRVYFLGFKDNPYKFIKKSDVFVFTSLYEGFPNALAEAVILRSKIVSFNFKAGANDLLPQKDLVEVGDINQLVEKILNAIVYNDVTKDIKEISEEFLKVLNEN